MTTSTAETRKLYQQVANAIAESIREGEFQPGHRLPSERDLAEEYKVSRPTVREALTVLQFAPQAASEQVYKVLASAVANAENNERLDPDSLLVRAAYVDEGPTLKRFRPRAQGRAYRIRKRTCHITIEVESGRPQIPNE